LAYEDRHHIDLVTRLKSQYSTLEEITSSSFPSISKSARFIDIIKSKSGKNTNIESTYTTLYALSRPDDSALAMYIINHLDTYLPKVNLSKVLEDFNAYQEQNEEDLLGITLRHVADNIPAATFDSGVITLPLLPRQDLPAFCIKERIRAIYPDPDQYLYALQCLERPLDNTMHIHSTATKQWLYQLERSNKRVKIVSDADLDLIIKVESMLARMLPSIRPEGDYLILWPKINSPFKEHVERATLNVLQIFGSVTGRFKEREYEGLYGKRARDPLRDPAPNGANKDG
jgi:hypothetical protein